MIPFIQPPATAETEALHEASLRVLEQVGVAFPSHEAQAVLAQAGASVNAETGVVKIPARLVDEALAAAPGDVLLAGRDPGRDVRCDGRAVHLTLDGTGAYTLDHRTGERRPSTLQDLADATRVADAAPEVDVVWNIVCASDVPPTGQVMRELGACLRNTGKHVQGEVQRVEEVPFVMEMLAAASPSGRWDPARPFFSIVYCPVPPLQHEPEMLEAGMALAREGVPMCVYSMGLAGATAPASVAGAVMQANAEILSAIVLFQLLREGLGCIYVADTGVLDMRTGAYTAASPEAVLITQAMVGLARAYDLPVMATGLTGDANCFSSMSGSDAGVSVVTSMLMRPDLLVGAGMHDGAQMLSLPKILIDCELFRQCGRILEGMTVDQEHLMTDVVAEVGPGGHFLKAKATRRFIRGGEFYAPRLMPREPYDAWSVDRVTEVERATAAVEEIRQRAPPPAAAARGGAGVLRRRDRCRGPAGAAMTR